jgi:hypothetical protein
VRSNGATCRDLRLLLLEPNTHPSSLLTPQTSCPGIGFQRWACHCQGLLFALPFTLRPAPERSASPAVQENPAVAGLLLDRTTGFEPATFGLGNTSLSTAFLILKGVGSG